jgi:hypothetical protein
MIVTPNTEPDTIMEFINGIKMDVTLERDEGGNELVVLLTGANRMRLTPHQARMLATKLVMTVSRAEVRGKHKQARNFSAKPPG